MLTNDSSGSQKLKAAIFALGLPGEILVEANYLAFILSPSIQFVDLVTASPGFRPMRLPKLQIFDEIFRINLESPV